MYKKFALAMMMVLFLTPLSMAKFPSDVVPTGKEEIAKLSDEKLMDAYYDTVVEIRANDSYHDTSGFSLEEYKDYKALLKYDLYLKAEIQSRNLTVPPDFQK